MSDGSSQRSAPIARPRSDSARRSDVWRFVCESYAARSIGTAF